jgi:metal-responsive CopG/Arc/MetJ family transcriptional regulator
MKCCKSTGLSLPTELMKKIDSERGDISRSRFLLRLIEKAYEKEQKMDAKP